MMSSITPHQRAGNSTRLSTKHSKVSPADPQTQEEAVACLSEENNVLFAGGRSMRPLRTDHTFKASFQSEHKILALQLDCLQLDAGHLCASGTAFSINSVRQPKCHLSRKCFLNQPEATILPFEILKYLIILKKFIFQLVYI